MGSMVSNCCGASPRNDIEEEMQICSDCGDHCIYVDSDEICEHCGHTPATGACFYCKMD